METLAKTADFAQRGAMEEALQTEGIPFVVAESSPVAVLGQVSPIGTFEFRVNSEDLERAKEALCERGILCDVTERMLRRTIEEVVIPLLERSTRELDRLLHLVSINNRETVEAIFQDTLKLEGGFDLLQEFFFALARSESQRLRTLSRVLSARTSPSFLERVARQLSSADKGEQIALLAVVHEFVEPRLNPGALAPALLDSDAEIRQAADEALYNLTGSSHGYKPDASAEEREEVVQRICSLFKYRLPGGAT